MPYVAHLCSSSKLGCRGAERPSAAQRRGAPERRAVARGAPERLSGMSPAAVRHGPCRRPARALPPSGTSPAAISPYLGRLPYCHHCEPTMCLINPLGENSANYRHGSWHTRLEPWHQHADF